MVPRPFSPRGKLIAAEILRELLVAMFCSGALDAKALCVLCWWITLAGAVGVDDMGARPGLSSGNYNKHLTIVLKLNNGQECQQDMKLREPLRRHRKCSRQFYQGWIHMAARADRSGAFHRPFHYAVAYIFVGGRCGKGHWVAEASDCL